MERLELLQQARAAGLTVWADKGTLRVKGPRRLEPLVRQLLAGKAEVLAALDEPTTEPIDGFIQSVIDAFGGEVVEPSESCPLEPTVEEPGTAPNRACNGCGRSQFHKVRGGPVWICDRCHPGSGPASWTATWEAPAPSIFESMNRRGDQTERMDIRGLGKKGRRPTSWDGGQR